MTAQDGARPLTLVKGRSRAKNAASGQGQMAAGAAQLPCNPEAERITIGSVIDWAASAEYIPLLEPDDFYLPEHQTIWEVIRYDLFASGRSVTKVAVDDALAKRGQLAAVGGQLYIETLIKRAEAATPTIEHALIVFERFRERELIRMAGELARYAYSSADIDIVLLSHRAQLTHLEDRAKRFVTTAPKLPGVMADQVERRAVEWLWRGRLAYGKLSLVDGDPGKGKGLFGIDVAARMTTGRAMPDEDPRVRHEPCNVVLITPEDDPNDTIVPRLDAAGADLSRVRILNSIPTDDGESERPITFPQDIGFLEQVLTTDDARFFIIDPIMACLDADVKVQSDQEVRRALTPLKMLAERLRISGLLVRHMNKSGGDKAIYRGGGSIAFTGLARVTMLLAEHPDDDGLVVLAGAKTNIGKLPASLAFSIQAEYEDATPHLVWSHDAVTYSADALLGAKRSDERREYIAVLRANGHAMTPHDVALALGVPPDQESKVRRMLSKMAKAGEISQPSYGYYAV